METTETLRPNAPGLARAAALLREGRLVAFPTETVYGLGADATSDIACARIFEAKGRPRFNPLIAHVDSLEMARSLAEFDERAEALAAAFWPGPLTLVLPSRGRVSPLVTADLPTVALRFPAHPVARALIAAAGRPLAAPSANPSGRVSPTRAAHVLEGLSGRIAAVVDGGPCAVGVESTILGVFETLTLLRPGGLAVEEIERLTGPLALPPKTALPNAPGQLESHYAPNAPLRLNASTPGAVHIGFGPEARGADRPGLDEPGAAATGAPAGDAGHAARVAAPKGRAGVDASPTASGPQSSSEPDLLEAAAASEPGASGPQSLNLSPAGSLVEAAANLFHLLRQADTLAAGREITVAPIPEEGLGRAINDRLRRAAAPR